MSLRNDAQNRCRILGDNVRDLIRSGVAITSVTQCVEELVLNSIDAEATRIFVDVDLSDFIIRVEDNGTGIIRKDFDIIGTRYVTSKCHTLSDLQNLKKYGYRGEALASIIEVSSTVEIYSRARSDERVFCRKFKNGVSCGTARGAPERKRSSPGLTVTVYGLLSKLPVRQKQVTPLEIEHIKKVIERIYLMNSRIQIDFRHQRTRILQTLATQSVAEAFQFLYKKYLIEVFSSYDVFYFQAWFSKEPHHSKSLQFVYVNNRFVSRNQLHRTLDMTLTDIMGLYKKSVGGNNEERPAQKRQREKKYPIFVVNILSPLTEYDVTLEPMKSHIEFKDWELVLQAAQTLEHRFKSAIQAESKNKLIVDWVKNSHTTEDTGEPPTFGKTISTRNLNTALHSKIAKRLAEQSPQHNDYNGKNLLNSADSSKECSDDDDEIEIEEIEEIDRLPSLFKSKSKMSQFRSPERPKLSPQNPKKLPCQKVVSKRRLKLQPNVPLFPNGYNNNKHILSHTKSATYDDSVSNIVDKIQEKFPVFRNFWKQKTSPTAASEYSSESHELPVKRRRLGRPNKKSLLDSSFQRLSVTQDLKKRQGEKNLPGKYGTLSQKLDETKEEPSLPNEMPDDHFLGIMDVHLTDLRQTLGLPDLAEETAAILQDESEKEKELVEEPRLVPTCFLQPSQTSSSDFAAQNDVESYFPTQVPKSVAEMVEFVLENQRQSNYSTRQPSADYFTSEYFPTSINRGEQGNEGAQIGMSPFLQRPPPRETGIPNLETFMGTTSTECRFQKEDLQQMRVIGQVDNKFIVAKSLVNGKESLVLFDQHAVHERIRLERLLQEIQESGTATDFVVSKIKRVTISPPLELTLSDTEVRVLTLYTKQFELIGIRATAVPQQNSVFIHSAPRCFVERISTESRINSDELIINLIQKLIEQQVKYVLDTNGNLESIPQATFEILCAQACRGAIKFGDHLDQETCAELISQLALCNNPFQCAHGRPVLTPLLDLTSVPGTPAYRARIGCCRYESED